jgi:hypothetical protein
MSNDNFAYVYSITVDTVAGNPNTSRTEGLGFSVFYGVLGPDNLAADDSLTDDAGRIQTQLSLNYGEDLHAVTVDGIRLAQSDPKLKVIFV